MADSGTFLGEVQRGFRRFWGTRWFIKWPVMVFGGLALLAIVVPGSDDTENGDGARPAVGADESTEPASTKEAASDKSTPEPERTTVPAGTPEATNTPGATDTPRPTNTPKPTNTPQPTNTPKPTSTPVPPTATPPPAGYSFGSGKKLVGTDALAGVTYRTRTAAKGCYWERLTGLGGTLGEIAANDNTDGPAIVTVGAGDVAFNSQRCGTWTQDLSAITAGLNEPFKEGTYFVNVDIAPGVWQSDGTGSCYWERLANFSGGLSGIIANEFTSGPTIVQIGAGDAGFKTNGCGTWRKAQ